ncbi:LOW QUALITY PROTEIN: Mitochondrial inner membrane i-AAA protease complex subunit MGR1, partial [Frankliniella fusca]
MKKATPACGLGGDASKASLPTPSGGGFVSLLSLSHSGDSRMRSKREGTRLHAVRNHPHLVLLPAPHVAPGPARPRAEPHLGLREPAGGSGGDCGGAGGAGASVATLTTPAPAAGACCCLQRRQCAALHSRARMPKHTRPSDTADVVRTRQASSDKAGVVVHGRRRQTRQASSYTAGVVRHRRRIVRRQTYGVVRNGSRRQDTAHVVRLISRWQTSSDKADVVRHGRPRQKRQPSSDTADVSSDGRRQVSSDHRGLVGCRQTADFVRCQTADVVRYRQPLSDGT